ncbi:MAG TPA: hypothetical protein VIY49_39460 [Bryobacteraceae bacterium]
MRLRSPALPAGAGCERRDGFEPAFSPARKGGVELTDGLRSESVADIYAAPSIEVIESTREDELDALRSMRKYADQRVTFTDCVSFAIMRRRHIRRAFSFDRHFRHAGFSVIGPSGAGSTDLTM